MRARLMPVYAFIFSAALPFSAQAAPQILGLIATATPLPLQCADGICIVDVSGVCLQEHRPAPRPGTAYRAAENAALTLVVHTADGSERRRNVAAAVDIVSLRGFNSVAVRLPQQVIRDLGGRGARAALHVGPLASAVPLPVPNDATPLSAAEIAAYTGPLRAMAEDTFARDKTNLAATQVLNHMVNNLPADNSLGAAPIAALQRGLDNRPAITGSPDAASLVASALAACKKKLRVDRTPHLRACLSNQHDILNSSTTQRVWRALKPGS